MKNIVVSHSELGEVKITPNCKLESENKNVIKGLAFLQLVCMTPKEEQNEHFPELIDIIKDAAERANAIFSGEDNESNAVEQF